MNQQQKLGRVRTEILKSVRNAAGKKNAITASQSISLVADRHFDLARENIEGFIFVTMNVKRRSRSWRKGAVVQCESPGGIGSAQKPITSTSRHMAFRKRTSTHDLWLRICIGGLFVHRTWFAFRKRLGLSLPVSIPRAQARYPDRSEQKNNLNRR
jgi:hypothetical protein